MVFPRQQWVSNGKRITTLLVRCVGKRFDDFYGYHCHCRGRRGRLMASALDSGSSGPGSSPGRRI